MADLTVRARYEAEVAGYNRAMAEAARQTEALAKAADKTGQATKAAGDSASKAADKTAAAQKKAADAQDRAADAAGKLRVAQQKLDTARASGNADRVVAAEEAVARAQREVDRTSRDAAAAQNALQAELADTGNQAQKSQGKLATLSDAVRQNRADMEQLGGDMLKWGAGLTGLAAASGKFAMDWESDWTGVLKTNDGTSEQIARLEGDLRGLAKTLPATHSEIAAVAEAAGQLGVGIDDVSSFTKVMIDLGESTNLSAEEAATSIARFANITGLALSDVDQLGSALVGLGNNFATTEAEIMHMSMRVAAVGTQVGLTEGEILGLATAMSSVGVEAEAGGTAISMVMKKIDASVREGGESLTGWADAAGVSAQEFAAAWQSEPAVAMEMLVAGLGETAAAGGDVNGVLAELGVKGVRESDTLLRLASAGELLGDAFRTGNEELAKGSALAEEASKRYETTESKVRIAWNNMKDAAIDAGAVLLPVVALVAEGAASLAGAFSALPGPVKGGVAALSGVAGVGLLAGGALLKFIPAVDDTVKAVGNLTEKFPKAAGAAGKFARGIGIASAALVGFEVLKGIANDATPAAAGLEAVANAILAVGEARDLAALNELFNINSDVRSFGDALKMLDPSDLNSHMENFGETLGFTGTSSARARAQMVELDQVLSTMDPSTAAERMSDLREEAERTGSAQLSSWSELQKLFPEYAASVEAAANATGKATSEADLFQAAMGNLPPHMRATGDAAEGAAGGVEGLEGAMGELGEVAADTEKTLSEIVQEMATLGMVNRSAQAASDAHQQSLRDLEAALKDNGSAIVGNTEKAAANRAALREVAESSWDSAEAQAAMGAAQHIVRGELESGYQALLDTAKASGMNAAAADEWARSMMGIPTEVSVDTWMDDTARTVAEQTGQAVGSIDEGVNVITSMDDTARAKAFQTAEEIRLIPGHKLVSVAISEDGTAGQVQSKINAVTGKTEYVFVTDDGTVNVTQQKITGIDGKTEYVYVTDDGTVVATQGSINNIQGKTVDIIAQAQTAIARGELDALTATRYMAVVATVSTNPVANAAAAARAARGYQHGRIPGYAMGRVPYSGLGTDRWLGVDATGWPTIRVDDGEAIIRESSTRRHSHLLGMVNDDDPKVSMVGRMLGLPGYAGGRVGREWSGSATSTAPFDYDRLAAALSGGGTVINAPVTVHDARAGAAEIVGQMDHTFRRAGRGA